MLKLYASTYRDNFFSYMTQLFHHKKIDISQSNLRLGDAGNPDTLDSTGSDTFCKCFKGLDWGDFDLVFSGKVTTPWHVKCVSRNARIHAITLIGLDSISKVKTHFYPSV